MAASYVSLVLDVFAGSGSPAPQGYAKLIPSATLTDAPDQQWIPPIPVEAPFTGSAAPPSAMLLATDGGGPQPSGWTWGITFPGVPGQPSGFSFFVPAGPASFTVTDASPAVFTFTPTAELTSLANGTGVRLASPPAGFSAGVTYFVVGASGFTFELAASTGGPPIASQSAGSGTLTVAQVNLSAIAPAESGTAFASYMAAPSGTATAGMVPVANGQGGSAWGTPPGGSGTVTSVSVASANGLAGSVANPTTTPAVTFSTTASGVLKGSAGALVPAVAGTDYVTPTGSGAALTGITASQVGAASAGALAAETTRAETAEALLAPKASPALTGSPTAPTASPLTSSTQLATTAYADSAVAVETTRAEAAEALRAPLASPALTGSPTAPTAGAGTNTTQIATTAYALAAAQSAQSAAEAASDPAGSAATAQTSAEIYAQQLQPTSSSPLPLTLGGTGQSAASTAGLLSALGLGSAATQSASAFDAAGAASAARSAAEAASLPATDDLSAIATANATAGNVAMNSHKLTGLANGSASSDSAAYGQTPAGGSTVTIAQGGTGQTGQQAAINALTGSQSSGTYLRSNGTNASLSAIQAADVPTLNQSTTGTAAGLSATLAVASGGTGQTSQQAAMNALAGSQASAQYLRGNGTNVVMSAIQAADLPAATTSAQGAVQLDGTAADIAALGTRAAGSTGKAADAGHVHPTTGVLTKVADTGTTGYALTNGTGVITGMSWTAPSDGNLHFVSCAAFEYVTTAETGGAVKLEATTTQGPTMLAVIFAGGAGTGIGQANTQILVEPGQSVSLQQTSALTAGVSTLYAQIWAS